MGFWNGVGGKIRQMLQWDKEAITISLAKGGTGSGIPQSGFDLMQSYGFDALSEHLKLEQDMMSRYIDFEEMDTVGECASALDIYADDATTVEPLKNRAVWADSTDQTVTEILDDLLQKRLRIDEEAWSMARTLAKYGQDFEELLVSGDGVVGLNYLSPPTMRRIEGRRGELYGFIQDMKGRFGFCLAKGSRIWGGRGLEEIQNYGSESVLGYVNNKLVPLKLKEKHNSGIKKIFKLKTQHREVYLTEEHPVLTEHPDGSRDWIKVKDLKIIRTGGKKNNINYSKSDKLIICTRMPAGEVPEWKSIWKYDPFAVQWGNKGNPTPVTIPDRPTVDFCRLFGFMLGDGWVSGDFSSNNGQTEYGHVYTKLGKFSPKKNSAARVAFARGIYPELNELYETLLGSFGPKVKLKNGGEQAEVNSVVLARLFDSLGWINGAANKRIPAWIFTLPELHREAFLKGFIEADGNDIDYKSGLKSHNFQICNYDMCRDFKNLIDGLGYKSGGIGKYISKPGTVVFNKRTGRSNTIKTRRPAFNLHYSEDKFESDFVAENILSVTYYEDAEVFDLEVDDPAHNFIADGVVVHNSPDEFKQLLAQRSAMNNSEQNPFAQTAALEPWEVCHMRLRSQQRRSLMGTSVLESSRWIWKRLMLLEDAAMVYRLQRAPERYAFYVDVGDLPPKEAYAYLNKIRQQYKKTKFYSPSTGHLDLKNNPLGADQDFFMPIRKGVQGTRIDVLQSPTWTAMDDIMYFREKMFAALKVPKTYLGFSESVGKGSLSQEDVRFSKAVLRLQREMRNGFHKMARVHLASMNINPNALDYEIYMTVPSSIFELAQLEVRNAKADFAGRMAQFVSMHWILQKIFGLSDSEIEFVIKQRHDEQLMDADVQAKSMGMQQQTSLDVQNQAQAQAMQDQQGQAIQAAGQMAKAEPGSKKAEDAQNKLRELASLSRLWPQKRQQLGYRPISEAELFAGNRDHEKRIEDNLEKVLKYDEGFSRKLNELGGLVRELRGSMPRK